MSALSAYPLGANVIALNFRQHRQPLPQRLAAHSELFTTQRRDLGDVMWLKENAEYLNILECTGQQARAALDAYEETYDTIDVQLAQFPQYYRFFLSIALDYEDLGGPGNKAESMCAWAQRRGLAEPELSDLQRAEAHRLLGRRLTLPVDAALQARLHAFMARSETFAIPNQKAAYELTHIVFYLSQYGRCTPGLPDGAIQSLTYCGLLAYLDQNLDLLAEICIALRYAGETPNKVWEAAVMTSLHACEVSPVFDAHDQGQDAYHTYLVSSWAASVAGHASMPALLQGGPARFDMPQSAARPLRVLSQAVAETRCCDWQIARPHIVAQTAPADICVLEAAEASVDQFGAFFEIFARAERIR